MDDRAPYGEHFYEQQQRMWGYPADSYYHGYDASTKKAYEEARDAALADPDFDFFEHYLPTGRSKHDIGYYALRNGLNVPLITSMQDLRDAAEDGSIMIRSDGRDEYDGPSGLRNTYTLGRVMPSGRYYHDGNNPPYEDGLTLGVFNGQTRSLDGVASNEAVYDLNRLATAQILSGNLYPGAQFGAHPRSSSLWHKVGGDNISVMRDPIQDDLYHFRWGEYVSSKIRRGSYDEGYPVFRHGDGMAKNWQRTLDGGGAVSEHWFGSFIPNKRNNYYGYHTPTEDDWVIDSGAWVPHPSGLPEFWAPVGEMIDTYEKVRTLPLFDQRQVPVMEMQYDRKQSKLHFLQYLKTGRVLQHLDAFQLPEGNDVVSGLDVIGATPPEGEKMRIHIGVTTQNTVESVSRIQGEGVLLPLDLILGGGGYLQTLAMASKATFLDYRLTFFNHHFGSAMFTRTPLSVGLMDWKGAIAEKLLGAHYEYLGIVKDGSLGYVNAIVTSNGREVTVQSDWQPHQIDES